MLPDRWTVDMSAVWSEVAAAWGQPDREEEILRWLQRRSPGEWARLDESERSWRASHQGLPSTTSSTLARGWRSFSASGHEREAAVRALEHDPHDVAIGFLLVRCDDWVDAVRLRARTAVLSRAAEGRMDVATWMPLLLARDARARASGLVEACVALSPPGLPEALLHHPDRVTRRWALERVLAREPEAHELEDLLEAADDAAVAGVLATRLAVLVDDVGLQRLLAGRRLAVRRVAWERVVSGRLRDVDLRAGLLDASRNVRALAQQAARARGVDAGNVYLDAPRQTPAQRRRRLVGLGEWAAKEAVSIAHTLLDDPDPSVRMSAIDVLALRMDHPEALLLDLLRSRRGGELRAVRRGLLLNHVRVGDADLAFLRGGDAEQRIEAWRLGRARGRWERLLAALLALGDADVTLSRAAALDLASWCQRVAAEAGSPSTELRPALEAALRAAPGNGRWRDVVAFVLRT